MAGNSNQEIANFASKQADPQVVLSLARVAETAERYEDMCNFMHNLVTIKCSSGQDLDVEERNLLSVAYKNVVGSKRASWRTLSDPDEDKELSSEYKAAVEKELRAVCAEVLDLLTNKLIAVATSEDETLVFYHKMAGDYYRYLAELAPGDGSGQEDKNKAEECYTKAMDAAKGCLPETHPTRLGLALNFSVCYYEILKKPTEACALAKEAFDAAIEKLDTLNDASYKDSTLIMQLLRDNLTLWTSESQEDDVQD